MKRHFKVFAYGTFAACLAMPVAAQDWGERTAGLQLASDAGSGDGEQVARGDGVIGKPFRSRECGTIPGRRAGLPLPPERTNAVCILNLEAVPDTENRVIPPPTVRPPLTLGIVDELRTEIGFANDTDDIAPRGRTRR
jgi:hypothetical protein